MAKRVGLKFVFVALLLIMAMCFSACAEIRAMTIYNENGLIDEMVFVSLDRAKIESAGLDYQIFYEEVFENAQAYASEMIDEFKAKVFLTEYADFMDDLNLISKKGEDLIVVGIRFANVLVYKYFHGIDNRAEMEAVVENHFLYDKVIYTALTPFAYDEYQDLYSRIKKDFSTQYPEFVEFNETLLYTYVAKNRREHSDADFVNKVDGKYYHTWQVENGNTNKVITLYYNIANRAHCILLCLIVSLIFCGIVLLVGLVISQIQKRKIKKT